MFKNISVYIASIVLLFSLFISSRMPIVDMANEYEVYFKSYSQSSWLKTIDKNQFKFAFGVKGESFSLDINDFCLEKFLSQIEGDICFTENLENVVCYYGYSKKVKYLETLNGKIINVHIAIGENYVKVGFPIIYGSF